jgi:hypothetical protein
MYGFTPGTFRRRDPELDMGAVYETVEGPWLASFLDYHAERVDRTGEILDVTQGGLSTGILFMSEETAEQRDQPPVDWVARNASAICRVIDAEILDKLVKQMEESVYKATAIPGGMLSNLDPTTPGGLKAHEQMLINFPLRDAKAARLRALGLTL